MLAMDAGSTNPVRLHVCITVDRLSSHTGGHVGSSAGEGGPGGGSGIAGTYGGMGTVGGTAGGNGGQAGSDTLQYGKRHQFPCHSEQLTSSGLFSIDVVSFPTFQLPPTNQIVAAPFASTTPCDSWRIRFVVILALNVLPV